MLQINIILDHPAEADDHLTLPFESRQKSRLRACTDGGAEVALNLPRGRILRDGDCLRSEDGQVLQVHAAPEQVSTVHVSDAALLARTAYHLGNRHVPLQVTGAWLRYLHDHVLDEMVVGLGLTVTVETAPFEPEAGAYGGGHHHHHD